MRLTTVDREESGPGDDTKHLIVEASRLNVEAKHLKLGAPSLANEAKHLKVEAPNLIVEPSRLRSIGRTQTRLPHPHGLTQHRMHSALPAPTPSPG